MRKYFLLFLMAGLIYFSSWFVVNSLGINKLAIQSEDTIPALFLPLSIIRHGNLYLDDFVPMMMAKYPNPDDKSYEKGMLPFYLRKAGEHYVSAFPIITPLLAIPFYLPFKLFNIPITWKNIEVVSHVASSCILALSGVLLFYLLFNKLKVSYKNSIVITICYLFGTINYVLVSQSLWQHGTLQLFIILSLIFLIDAFDNKLKALFWFSFFSGIAILTRPTAALPYIIISLYLFIKNWKVAVPLVIGMLPNIIFFLWYNNAFYQTIANQGYSNQIFKNWLGGFPMSFIGVWLSPSKGILVYSPIFIFSLVGFFTAIKTKCEKYWFYILCGICAFLHILVISFWKHWFGGWSFGYRMSSDVIPYLILLLVPFIQSSLYKKYATLFMILLIVSIAIELAGIVFFDGVWHAAYDRGFRDTSWLWSLKDSEFVFYLRRVLVKAGLLKSPFSF